MKAKAILETALYSPDLDRMEAFYENVLGLEKIARAGNRHVFFRCGNGVLLIFNPDETEIAPAAGQLPVPVHGARGPGHLCLSATSQEQESWERHLRENGIDIESRVQWPNGGCSIYFRDPAGNSVEFAEPLIWGFQG